jgi:hypothetical protein
VYCVFGRESTTKMKITTTSYVINAWMEFQSRARGRQKATLPAPLCASSENESHSKIDLQRGRIDELSVVLYYYYPRYRKKLNNHDDGCHCLQFCSNRDSHTHSFSVRFFRIENCRKIFEPKFVLSDVCHHDNSHPLR